MIVKHQVRAGLAIGAAGLATALVLHTLQRHDAISAETAMRILGGEAGLGAMILANRLPKRLVPLEDELNCDPAREQMLRRLGARVALLGGLIMTLVYAFAPAAQVRTLLLLLSGPFFLVYTGLLLRGEWVRRRVVRHDA